MCDVTLKAALYFTILFIIKKWKHSPPSFAVFCTVAVAPQFCSLSLRPNLPEPETPVPEQVS